MLNYPRKSVVTVMMFWMYSISNGVVRIRFIYLSIGCFSRNTQNYHTLHRDSKFTNIVKLNRKEFEA